MIIEPITKPIIEPITKSITKEFAEGGLILHLDASDSSTIIESSNAVTYWNDKSGNGNNAQQLIGTNQPLTNLNTINSLNVLTFDGSNDYLTIPALYNFSFQEFTVALVAQPTASGTGAGRDIINKFFSSGSPFVSWGIEYLNTGKYGIATGSTTDGYDRDDTNSIYGLSPSFFIAEFKRTSKKLTVDGLVEVNVSHASTAKEYNTQPLTIGSWLASLGTNSFAGFIGEILIYSKALNEQETTDLTNYFNNKWGT